MKCINVNSWLRMFLPNIYTTLYNPLSYLASLICIFMNSYVFLNALQINCTWTLHFPYCTYLRTFNTSEYLKIYTWNVLLHIQMMKVDVFIPESTKSQQRVLKCSLKKFDFEVTLRWQWFIVLLIESWHLYMWVVY